MIILFFLFITIEFFGAAWNFFSVYETKLYFKMVHSIKLVKNSAGCSKSLLGGFLYTIVKSF